MFSVTSKFLHLQTSGIEENVLTNGIETVSSILMLIFVHMFLILSGVLKKYGL